MEGGSVVSGGKFSVGECAVEEGATKERASLHVHQTEHHGGRDLVSLLFLVQLSVAVVYMYGLFTRCVSRRGHQLPQLHPY